MYDQGVIDRANAVAKAARQDFFGSHDEGAVVLSAIAGAGKSYFVVETVKEARKRGMRVAVSAPTNAQIVALANSIARSDAGKPVTVILSQDEAKSFAANFQHKNITLAQPAHTASGQAVVVGTIDKFAFSRNPVFPGAPALQRFDGLIMDEAYQADAGRYYAVGDIAPRHLTVGDGGQIKPFTTADDGEQWRGLPENPLQTAVDVLLRNHATTPVHRFPITRRLDVQGAKGARCFYPAEHEFGAAVLDGVRHLRLLPAVGGNQRVRAIDAALGMAARSGWAHVELPARHSLVADPEVARLLVDLVSRLFKLGPTVSCEREPRFTALQPARVAIGVSHNDQKLKVKHLLQSAGFNDVVVDTANRLQGLEFDVVLCWHPLSGLLEADKFHAEAGRMCVLATRHRHACIVVGRQGDRELVERLSPSEPAWPGDDSDEVLRGWEAHRAFFGVLQESRVAMPAG